MSTPDGFVEAERVGGGVVKFPNGLICGPGDVALLPVDQARDDENWKVLGESPAAPEGEPAPETPAVEAPVAEAPAVEAPAPSGERRRTPRTPAPPVPAATDTPTGEEA